MLHTCFALKMAFETPHIIVAVILVALSALYMLELSPHTDDGIVELRQTQVLLISQCDRVFSHIGDVSKYPTVSIHVFPFDVMHNVKTWMKNVENVLK